MIRFFLVKFIVLLSTEVFYVNTRFACDKQSAPCGCGFNNVEMNTHLTDSENAVPHSWSMVVSLQYDCHRNGNVATHCCSGTILSESYVLTSAQCVDRIDPSSILSGSVTVLAGIHHQSQPGGTSRTVDQIYIHSNWTQTSDGSSNDLAVLHLTEPFDFATNIFIARTCRPPRLNSLTDYMRYPADDTVLAVVGWSSMRTLSSIAPHALQQTAIHSINPSHSACAMIIKNAETQFCVRRQKDGTGLYNSGDAGAPAFQWIGNRWEQVGIISSNILGDVADNHKRAFTRIASYHNWIESIMSSEHPKIAVQMKILPLAPPVSRRYPIRYRCDNKAVSCGCGREQVILSPSRMFNDEEAKASSWSMIVSLRFNGTNQHVCSGSILSDFFILTAAHCVDKLPTSPIGLTVIGGIDGLFEGGVDIFEADRIYLHPNWVGSSDGYQNDIAILHLSQSLDMSNDPFVTRTCVPYSNGSVNMSQYPSNGTRLAMIGWGAIQQGTNNISKVLRQAEVFVIDNDDPRCKLSLEDKEKQFCAGLYDGAKDSCPSDSGGPIFQWKGKFWEQVGITSYRSGCGMEQRPSVYTRLAYYFDWMERVINGSLTTTTRTPPVTNPPVTYTCDKTAPCGCSFNDVALPSSRIVGGSNAVPYSWSMVVSLRTLPANEHICGGSILNDFFILTAAHCVMNRPTTGQTNLSVAVGGNQQIEFYQTVNEVDRIYVHPEWVPGQLGNWNDLAILHLSQPLNLSTNPFVKRTCLQRINSSTNMLQYPLNGTRLATIGWGTMEDSFFSVTTPEDLQQVELFVIDKRDEVCDKSIKDKARQFCAGIPGTGGKDSCRGDSGGPILEWKGNRWEQVGIVSYGYECANPRTPSVFTQVANYIDWIEKVINESLTITTVPSTGRSHHLCSIFLLLFVFVVYACI